jgi:hypothetical protein
MLLESVELAPVPGGEGVTSLFEGGEVPEYVRKGAGGRRQEGGWILCVHYD